MGKRGKGASPIDLSKIVIQAWDDESFPLWERVKMFCEALPCTAGKMAGKPFKMRPWQVKILKGIYKTQRGKPVVRQAVLSMARKNGKTALAAMLGLVHLCGPCAESRGQVFSAAADKAQAGLIFAEMVAIIERVPWLSCRCNITAFHKRITDEKTGSVYQALSSDARKAHGLSPSFVICDELAQWRSRDLYDNLLSGMGAREAPLLVAIGTQAAMDDCLMSELVDYGRKVSTGEVKDPTFFSICYSVPEDADPYDPAQWKKANPALGDFRSLEEMKTAAVQAQRIPAKESVFRNLYLNQRVDAAPRWIALPDWKACGAAVDQSDLYGRPCWAGLDLSSTTDLTALVLYFPDDGGAVLPFAWLPSENLKQRAEADRVPYDVWEKRGALETTQGRAVDKVAIACRLASIAADYDVRGIAYDRWRMEDLKRILDAEGINLPLYAFGQGYKDMAPAVDATEAAILSGAMRHGMHPVLTWCMSNVALETDPAGNRKLSKAKSRERIDLAVALVMACGLHARMTEEKPRILGDDFCGILLSSSI